MTRHKNDDQVLSGLRKFGSVLDLSRDIDRNKDDAEFADAGGKIIYIYDENIFESFFDPVENHFGVGFFSEVPSRNEGGVAYSPISMLAASEFLVTGALPGAVVGRPIYMTPWHRRELLNRIEAITSEIAERSTDDANKSSLKNGLNAASFFDLIVLGNGEPRINARKVAAIQELSDIYQEAQSDLKVLTQRGAHGRGFKDIDKFRDRYTRVLVTAASMARSTRSISDAELILAQIRRTIRAPLADRFRVILEDFSVDEADLGAVQLLANEWLNRLSPRAEQARRGTNATWSDARGLALVHYLARKNAFRDDIRFVMITGDRIMFEVYREWYVSLMNTDEDISVPFFLRRTAQYTPIFNLLQSRSDLADSMSVEMASTFLSSIREAVEIALLPLNLSRYGDKQSKGKMRYPLPQERAREHLAHLAVSKAGNVRELLLFFFPRGDIPQWAETQSSSYDELADQWRRLNRMAIGLSSGLVFGRALSIMSEAAEYVDPSLSEKSNVLGRITRLVTDTRTMSIDLWRQPALEIFERMSERVFVNSARFPKTVWISIPTGHRLWAAIAEKERSDQLRAAIEGRDNAALLFASAAIFSLLDSRWDEAERFAALAVDASKVRAGKDKKGSLEEVREMKFLRSLVRRFAIGELAGSLPSKSTRRELSHGLYELNKRMLLCRKELDAIELEWTEPEGRESLNLMRVSSERAALLLFCAAARICMGVSFQSDFDVERRDRLIQEAEVDLMRARSLDKRLDRSDLTMQEDASSVRLQYLSNWAVANLMRWLFSGRSESGLTESSVWTDIENLDVEVLPAFVRFEVKVALAIYNKTGMEQVGRLNSIDFDCRLDKTFYDAITAKMAS